MSKYTTEVRFICEKYAGKDISVDYSSIDSVIAAARPHIFDFNYPIFREEYKPRLESKILKHFYTREICAETVGLWKLFLNRKLNEIMPYYNQRYASELITFNPLHNVDQWITRDDTFNGSKTNTNGRNTTNSGRDVQTLDRDIVRDRSFNSRLVEDEDTTDTGSKTGSSDTDGTETTTGWSYEADTPQSAIKDINDDNYATRATKNTGSTTYSSDTDTSESHSNTGTMDKTTTKADADHETTAQDDTLTTVFGHIIDERENLAQSVENLDKWIEHFEGKAPGETYSEMLIKFRETFLNIDMEIIEQLNPLFFNLW